MNLLFTLLQSSIAALLFWIALGPGVMPTPAMAPPQRGEGYWHTNGNQILDASNHPVRIAGINWYGFETTNGAPGGLDMQDYRAILADHPQQRLQHHPHPLLQPDGRIPHHPHVDSILQPQRPHQRRPQEASTPSRSSTRSSSTPRSAGLKVILDNHRSEAGDGPEANGLWYTHAYPESSWIADWQMLARRYDDNPTVIGMDLRNEPHNANSQRSLLGLRRRPTTGTSPPNAPATPSSPSTRNSSSSSKASTPTRRLLLVGRQPRRRRHHARPPRRPQPARLLRPRLRPNRIRSALVHQRHHDRCNPQRRLDQTLGLHQPAEHRPRLARRVRRPERRSRRAHRRRPDGNAVVQIPRPVPRRQPRINWTYWALNGDDRYGLLDGRYDAAPWDNDKQQALTALQFPLNFPTENNPTPFTEDKLATNETTVISPTIIRPIKR